MRRRHLLALVILALVVATVLAWGPVRVWDWMTLRTVEEYWPNGQMRFRYHRRLWESGGRHAMERDYDGWDANGQKRSEMRYVAGTGTGIITLRTAEGEVSEQWRQEDRVIVEKRTSPPWFTEEEILQAVEGVEE